MHPMKTEEQMKQSELLGAIEMVLDGFEKSIFVRSIAGDGNADWTIKLLPYLRALSVLQQWAKTEAETANTIKEQQETKETSEQVVPVVMRRLPNIEIDKEAIRFEFTDGSGVNMFWVNLFMPAQQFHNELLMNIFRAYNECVLENLEPLIEEYEEEEGTKN